LKLNIGLFVLG